MVAASPRCGEISALAVLQHGLAQGQIVFQRHRVMQLGGRAYHEAAFGGVDGAPHGVLDLLWRSAGKQFRYVDAAG